MVGTSVERRRPATAASSATELRLHRHRHQHLTDACQYYITVLLVFVVLLLVYNVLFVLVILHRVDWLQQRVVLRNYDFTGIDTLLMHVSRYYWYLL